MGGYFITSIALLHRKCFYCICMEGASIAWSVSVLLLVALQSASVVQMVLLFIMARVPLYYAEDASIVVTAV